jgi:hypothetical protein
MIKYKRTTRTAIIFEDTGEMHDIQTETDVMMVLPKWACKGLRGLARLAYLAKLEIKVWKSNASLLNKVCYGYQMAA